MNTEMNDKLDVLIALSAKDCGNDDVEMFRKLDTSNVSLDKSFYRKKQRVINRYRHQPTVTILKKNACPYCCCHHAAAVNWLFNGNGCAETERMCV